MPAPTRRTTLSSASFDLNRLDPTDSYYYDATLSGNFVSATAHIRVLTGDPLLQGDTLTATGRNSTLFGGAGKDSLIALGSLNYLVSGTGADTLIGTTLAGASTTLVGNGLSSLVGRGGNDVFVVSEGDKIGGVAGGTDSIRTGISNFSLTDTTTRGSGVLNVQNLIYTGLGGATLTGNALNGSMAGSTTSANSLVAGTGTQTLIGGDGNDTLRGNGKSLLVGGSGADTYYINQSGSGSGAKFDKVAESAFGGTDTARTTISNFNLADTLKYGSGIANVERLVFEGSGNATLIGNVLDNTVTGGAGNDFLSSGGGYDSLSGGAGNDTIMGNRLSILNGGDGDNTYYVYSQGDVIRETGNSTVLGSSVIGVNSGPAPFVYDLSSPGNQTRGVTRLQYAGGSVATLAGNSNRTTVIGGIGTNSLMAGASSSGSSLVGNVASDTLNDNGTASTMSGGRGDDFYRVANASARIEESSGLSGGIDSILTTLGSYDLAASNVAGGIGVENLFYVGTGLSGTLSGNQLSNLIDATRAGSVTLTGNGGSDTLLGSANSSSLLRVSNASDLGSSASVKGGTAHDTLQIMNAGTVADSLFGDSGVLFVRNVEYLQVTAPSDVTLGVAAQSSGIQVVIGDNGGNAFTQLAGFSNALTLVGGAGNDSFSVAARTQLLSDSIIGGSNTDAGDTLCLAEASSYAGSDFDKVSGIEVLSLTGGSSVTLSSGAGKNIFSTVRGGNATTVLNASSYTTGVKLDNGASAAASSLLGGKGGDTLSGGTGNDTLQAWSGNPSSNTAGDTLLGGNGSDLFVLGNGSGNAYGNGGNSALIRDFIGGDDYIQLKDWGSGASDYRVDASAGTDYTHQLFDTHTGSDVLVATINYSGTNATNDLLGSKALFVV